MQSSVPESSAAIGEQFSIIQWGVTPWLVFIFCLTLLLALALTVRVYPTMRLTWPILIILLPALAAFVWPDSFFIAAVCVLLPALVIGLAAIVDLITLPSPRQLSVSRTAARVASIGARHETKISFENRSSSSFRALVSEDTKDGLVVEPEFHRVRLPAGKRTTTTQFVTASERGAYELEWVYVDIFSRFGLWRRQCKLPCHTELHVYPDIKQIGEYALLARTNRLSQIGVRRTRRAGQDNDFERLRDYQQDDNYRHIDWRSTARRQKLTVRQFQTDQSQRVIFLVDCGRMMTNEHENRSLLDHALNAVLMLSYVALDQGDSVGMICFSDRIHTYVPPASGRRHMNRLLHAGFNQFPELVQSRFDEAFLYLSQHCRRRSLVVLISNVIDEVNAQQIENYMQNLVGAHLPLLVLLRDHRIFEAADNPSPDPSVLFRSAAASQLLVWRNQVIRSVQARGSLTLDVFPEKMTASLVNQYLEVKARHLL